MDVSRKFSIALLLVTTACGGQESPPGSSDTTNSNNSNNNNSNNNNSNNNNNNNNNTNNNSNNNNNPECFEAADTCSGEKVCVGGSCEAAFNRFYRIIIVDGELPATKPDRTLWDEGAGDASRPDPYVEIFADGVRLGRTSTERDTWFPTWNEQAEALLVAGSDIRMVMFDEDLVSDDEVFTCVADPITPELLRGRDLMCRHSTIDDLLFRVRIEPKT